MVKTIEATLPWDDEVVPAGTSKFVDVRFYTAEWNLPDGYGWACVIRNIRIETPSDNFSVHIYRMIADPPQDEDLVFSSSGHMNFMEESPNVFYADKRGEKMIHILFENDDTKDVTFDVQIDYEARAMHKSYAAERPDLEPGVYGHAMYGTSVYGKK